MTSLKRKILVELIRINIHRHISHKFATNQLKYLGDFRVILLKTTTYDCFNTLFTHSDDMNNVGSRVNLDYMSVVDDFVLDGVGYRSYVSYDIELIDGK